MELNEKKMLATELAIEVEVHCGFVRGENKQYYVEVSFHHGRQMWFYEIDRSRGARLNYGFAETFADAFNRLVEVMKDTMGITIHYSKETEDILLNQFGLPIQINWEEELA